ncbi:hypothetical protein QE152_g1402 [Popillia japonica]|uniref:Uncharacterized protein n=1 Tax=Popillia japonica TaxID=7064 RepID=A0AAW1N7E8_POPJA
MNKESFTNLDSDFESSDESSTNILLHLKKGIGKKEDYLVKQKVGNDKNSVDDWIEIESNNDGLSSSSWRDKRVLTRLSSHDPGSLKTIKNKHVVVIMYSLKNPKL